MIFWKFLRQEWLKNHLRSKSRNSSNFPIPLNIYIGAGDLLHAPRFLSLSKGTLQKSRIRFDRLSVRFSFLFKYYISAEKNNVAGGHTTRRKNIYLCKSFLKRTEGKVMIHLATFLGMDMSQHIVFQILDGLVVILFLFLLYRMIRGTAAFQICIGLVVVYFMWWLSSLLGMPLLSNILNQVINVGVIAVLVIFQPEIRRFLLLLGNKDVVGSKMKKIYEQKSEIF